MRVLLCHQDRAVRVMVRDLLAAVPDVRVLGDVDAAENAVGRIASAAPDVVLVDGGAAGQRILRETEPGTKGLVLMEHPDSVVDAVRAGARGFLLSSCDGRELQWAIKAVARSEAYLAPPIAHRLLKQMVPDGRWAGRAELPESLTRREREVLGLVAGGLSNVEVAGSLVVSIATVKFHVSNLLGKLGLRDRVQLAVYAHRFRQS
ncbi:response regulator transcription factor [Actinosynnema sp. NPDC020468]|uniref:response regulator transcription factor n=1 Tax=Actinosynnema sp. NPDC020468 TaxID=3154488 RepID=UPI0033F44978